MIIVCQILFVVLNILFKFIIEILIQFSSFKIIKILVELLFHALLFGVFCFKSFAFYIGHFCFCIRFRKVTSFDRIFNFLDGHHVGLFSGVHVTGLFGLELVFGNSRRTGIRFSWSATRYSALALPATYSGFLQVLSILTACLSCSSFVLRSIRLHVRLV